VKKIVYFLFLAAVVFLGLELVCSLTGIETDVLHPRGVYAADPQAGFRFASNYPPTVWKFNKESFTFFTNRKGFRDLEREKDPPVVILGDSFVMGFGVDHEDTFPYLLEKKLKIPVGNRGVNAYGTHHALRLLKSDGVKAPLIILGFAIANDLADNMQDPLKMYEVQDDYLWVYGKAPEKKGLKAFLKKFHTYHILRQVYFRTKHILFERSRKSVGEKTIEGDASLERGYEATEPLLIELNDDVIKNGGKLLVMLIPPKQQLGTSERYPQERMAEILKRNHIACLEITGLDESSYLKTDSHLSRKGHETVAEQLARAIDPLGVLGEAALPGQGDLRGS